MADTSLTSRVQSGVVWNSTSVFVTYLVGLVRSVILARLLAPDDFGLFSMAATVLNGLIGLTTIGLEVSVINTKFETDEELSAHLDTVWTVDLIRRLLLTVLLAATARPAARFYGEARLSEILLLVSLTPLIQGFQNVGLLSLRKGVSFRRISLLEQATNIVSTAALIALALWTRDVWALVFGQLVGTAVGVALSYAFYPRRPRLAIDGRVLRRVLSSGKYVLLISVLAYLMTTADNILLGRLSGAAVLGTYVIAYGLAALPSHTVMSAIANVTLPAYAEISGADMERLERAFLRL